ncbi:MAG TPA: bifunctional hydroxymethylpyrimidine kinase/phosphomethylpyrimidine kinase, partial [Thermodesulfobacteriota bacterium]|nr:bifunctional hydroxymethylpyrimidine kinase/phosphomethylpyrimidine kinase [Thermodesulfobacteriota bacterium]
MKTILTIAGFDPSGGAGLLRDLKTFEDLGCRGVSVAAALTAQNSSRVSSTLAVPPGFLEKQVVTLLEEFSVNAVKIGMTGSAANIRAIESLIKSKRLRNIVLDPVLV